MSEQNQNTTQNQNGTNNQGNGNATQVPAQPKKDNIFIAGLKRAGTAVSNGWKAIKANPWTHALAAFTGTAVGGYAGFKLAESMRPTIPAVPEVPQISEPPKDDEQTDNSTVEYVDIPKDDPVAEEQ